MVSGDHNPAGGLSSYRIAIAHDYFGIRGGGERLVLTMAHGIGARLVFGYRGEDSYDSSAFPSDSYSLRLPTLLRRPAFRIPALALRFAAARKVLRPYSVRLFSGVSAPFAAASTPGARNIYYCHTPPRFLYDQRRHFSATLERNLLGRMMLNWYQRGYEAAVERMDVIVANSENTRARIERYLGRDSVVVHPPVDTDRFVWRGQGNYYLSTARLTPLKRVDRIVEAFLAMPDKRLVVTSGGEELARLKVMAAGAPNIEFRGWVSDGELIELVGNAIATVYLPTDEDFGMSPVESMAAGKPVIGVAEGGLLETILPDRTGKLLPPEFTVPDIVRAVTAMTPERAAAMREDCEARAQDFSRERFIAGMHEVIERALQQDRDRA